MNAFCSIPTLRAQSRSVFNSKCMITWHRHYALALISSFSKQVELCSFDIFNNLLYYHSLRKSPGLFSFMMNSSRCSISGNFLCVPESIRGLVNWPLIVALLLLPRGKISVTLFVHLLNLRRVLKRFCRIHYLFD